MQKLLRRTPPPLLLSPSSLSPPPPPPLLSLSNPISMPYSSSSSTLFIPPLHTHHHHRRSYSPKLAYSTGVPPTTTFSSRACPLVCRCSNDLHRPWVGFKGVKRGPWLTWSHTAAGDSRQNADQDSDGATQSEDEGDETVAGSGDAGSCSEGKKAARAQRRRSSGSGSSSLVAGSADLLTVPGVGPRNLRKLVDKGIGAVAELKQLYRDKFFGKSSQNMVEYLQSSVGIIHRNHAESITTFIKKSVDEEITEDGSTSGIRSPKDRITLCVEGNISVGKTTFLKRIANETIELQDLVEVVPEPVDKWQNVGADHFNILDAFYNEPERYAYTFQNYVFVTRLMQERDSSAGKEPLRLMERSVFSDRMVFVRAVHEAKWMNEMEISIYDSWFDPVVSSLPGLIPDGFIYLRASPDTCHKRMMLRKRAEEGGVSLDYLRDLHEKHESWFYSSENANPEVLSVSKPLLNLDSSLHPVIKDRVYYLEGPHMHTCIQKVPALILDCEPDIDFNRDIEAKTHYARQVAEFFAFVKKKKKAQPSKADGHPEVILPHNGALWVPDSKHFPDSALQSLDLNRAMSAVSG